MKPTTLRNKMILLVPQHTRSKQLGSILSKVLKEKYHKNTMRVIEGDSVKVMRGEFKGIDGKVTHVSIEKKGVAIEGIKREKLKGGNVDIYIHASNVMITNLNLEDKWRQNKIERQRTKTPKDKPEEKLKEAVKEVPKESEGETIVTKPQVKAKEQQKLQPTPKQKDKPAKLDNKRSKQTKAAKKSTKKETK